MVNTNHSMLVLFCILIGVYHSIVAPLLLIELREDNFSLKQGHIEMNNILLEFLGLVNRLPSFVLKETNEWNYLVSALLFDISLFRI